MRKRNLCPVGIALVVLVVSVACDGGLRCRVGPDAGVHGCDVAENRRHVDSPCASACDGVLCGPNGCGGKCECPAEGRCMEGYCYDCEEEGWCNALLCESDGDPCTLEKVNPATGECVSKFNPDCVEPLSNMARIYRGAQAYYSMWECEGGKYSPPQLAFGEVHPLGQGITPVEATCCADWGGADGNNDGFCDMHSPYHERVWHHLDFRFEKGHRYVYSFDETGSGQPGEDLFEIQAIGDLDCDGGYGWFTLKGRFDGCGSSDRQNRLSVPAEVHYRPEADEPIQVTSPHIGVRWDGKDPCDKTTHGSCGYRIEHRETLTARYAEPLQNLLRMYLGARRLFTIPRAETGAPDCLVPPDTQAVLEKYPSAFPQYLPISQGLTPVEEACCSANGGHDLDGDGLGDAKPENWESPVWENLGFELFSPHQFAYSVSLWPADDGTVQLRFGAQWDSTCDTSQEGLLLAATLAAGGPGCELSRPDHVSLLPWGLPKYPDSTPWAAGILITPDNLEAIEFPQMHGPDPDMFPPAHSFERLFSEPISNLHRIAAGLSSYYEEECELPWFAEYTPGEGTCCAYHSGPDSNGNQACDANLPDWEEDGWGAIEFSIPVEHFYVYSVASDMLFDGKMLVSVTARGDLNCNHVHSTVERFGIAQQTPGECSIQWLEGYHIDRLFE